MENTLRPIEYNGFVLIPEERGGFLVRAKCDEIAFLIEGSLNYSLVSKKFKEAVDEIMNNKVPTSDSEKELNRLKLLLFMQPEVFYGTNQVRNLLTLCEELLEASKKKELKTKRVKQLVVGDIVIFPYCKGHSTIDLIKKIDGEPLKYGISTKEVNSLGVYFGDEEVVYLHNEKDFAK